jgi:hypothetical protein
MIAIHRWTTSWLRSLNDVTRLCLGMTAACFVVGAILGLGSYFLPLGSRSTALFFVGCFYLSHAVFELLKQQWRYVNWLTMLKRVGLVPRSLAMWRASEWEERAAA